MRDALGLKLGVDVTIEVRGEEIVMSKPKVEGSYTEYYVSTALSKAERVHRS
jgi:bifunctional DNA-binding transcriptional regulator/antitoxin component of YhaV-PrlF toxin-antitoxin module